MASGRVNIFTRIEGVKQYVRRIRVGKYSTVVTMLTTSKDKAMDFGSFEKAQSRLKSFGIGYAIEDENIIEK